MKAVSFLLVIFLFFIGCSSPKEAPAKPRAPKPSADDLFRGGTSFSNPVVIRVENEITGIQEEYTWLTNNYPGYKLVRRTQTTKSSRQYDIVRIRTKQGKVKDIYFDSTSFRGK